jgi:hypothetical protein
MIKIYFDYNIPDYILYLTKNLKFEMSSYDKCDYIISCKLKNTYLNNHKEIQNLLNYYSKESKKIIFFLISSIDNTFNIPYNVLFIRTSLFKSKKKINEFSLPIIWNLYNENKFKSIKITNFPIIGYYGKINKFNENLIKILQKTDNIITNFNFKSELQLDNDLNNEIDIIEENNLIKNIEDSHFYLCLKENSNFPSKLYKALSLGRIPIILDNNFYLPYEGEIDWSEIAIIGKDEKEITNKLKIWWIEKDIICVQNKCKEISNKYFNVNTYLENLFLNLYDQYNIYNSFSFPFDFDIDIYNKYNDLKNLSYSDLIKHYLENGQKEGRIYKLPLNFNVNNYRTKNPDLISFNYDELIKHYIYNGYKEKRIF